MNPFDIVNSVTSALNHPITRNDTQTIDIASQANTISPISSIGSLVQTGASAILTIGSLAFLFYLLMGGFNWLTAGGDKGKVEHAREMITQGIIGIAILASVFALYGVVLRFFGVTSIQLTGQRSSATTTSAPSTAGCSDYCAGTTQTGTGLHPDQCQNQGGHRVSSRCTPNTTCASPTYPCLIP